MTRKITISLTDAHAEAIDKSIASGEYATASEAIRAALRPWVRDRRICELWDEGIASGEAEPWNVEDTRRRMHERIAEERVANRDDAA